jgi:hypothetical protein
MTFVTTGDETSGRPELWYATFRESAPGVLGTDGYRAVPLAPTTTVAQSAGGLVADPFGALQHFWPQGPPSIGKLFEWRTFSE